MGQQVTKLQHQVTLPMLATIACDTEIHTCIERRLGHVPDDSPFWDALSQLGLRRDMTLAQTGNAFIERFAMGGNAKFQSMKTEHLIANTATVNVLDLHKLVANQVTVTNVNGKPLSLGGASEVYDR